MTTPDALRQEAEQLLDGLIDCDCYPRAKRPCARHVAIRCANLKQISAALTRTRQQAQAEERERCARIAKEHYHVATVNGAHFTPNECGEEIALNILQPTPPETP